MCRWGSSCWPSHHKAVRKHARRGWTQHTSLPQALCQLNCWTCHIVRIPLSVAHAEAKSDYSYDLNNHGLFRDLGRLCHMYWRSGSRASISAPEGPNPPRVEAEGPPPEALEKSGAHLANRRCTGFSTWDGLVAGLPPAEEAPRIPARARWRQPVLAPCCGAGCPVRPGICSSSSQHTVTHLQCYAHMQCELKLLRYSSIFTGSCTPKKH